MVFADPTQEEEDLVKGTVTIVTVNNEEVCMIHKPSTSILLGLVWLKAYRSRLLASFCLMHRAHMSFVWSVSTLSNTEN